LRWRLRWRCRVARRFGRRGGRLVGLNGHFDAFTWAQGARGCPAVQFHQRSDRRL